MLARTHSNLSRRSGALLALALLALVIVAVYTSVASGRAGVSIVGGVPATPQDNPSQVGLIGHDAQDATDGLFCGGTLIAPQVVVTAAHCVKESNGSTTRASTIDVVGGALKRSDPAMQRVRVVALTVHPGYSNATNFPDVAVLKLAAPLVIPTTLIATPDEATSQRLGYVGGPSMRVTGWGLTAPKNDNSQPDALLVARGILTRPLSECTDLFPPPFDANTQICASANQNRPDSCQGDSGGGLLAGNGVATRLVGVTSFGAGCAVSDEVGVYTRLSSLRGWIYQVAGLTDGGAVIAPKPRPPAPPSRVRTRIGNIICGAVRCLVYVKVYYDSSRVRGVAVSARRPGSNGLPADSRSARARRVRRGLWRANIYLPLGSVTISAQAFDSLGRRIGSTGRDQFEITQ